MREWKGIGYFVEDFVEQAHQFRSMDEKRTLNTKDKRKKAQSHSRWEMIGYDEEVIKAGRSVQIKTEKNAKEVYHQHKKKRLEQDESKKRKGLTA
mmetsp:Transcript_33497/g.37049  ORF Transcript_33497/g.37049 Transcript_33497/m.37049 type:complete len:95 (+) Transcript_33497:245-529(+)